MAETPGSLNLGVVIAIVVVVLLSVALGAVVMIFIYLITKYCRKSKLGDDPEADESGKKTIIQH